jgi:hypothetical protein
MYFVQLRIADINQRPTADKQRGRQTGRHATALTATRLHFFLSGLLLFLFTDYPIQGEGADPCVVQFQLRY